jgi:hypothetical protein
MSRRFETDYAGAWKGHCVTRESAILAAVRHIVQDGYSRATITDKVSGEVVARVSLSNDRRNAQIDTEKALRKVKR